MKIVSWIALIVSIVSLAFTMNVCFAQRMYDTNYMGMVISALGVIVTLLIGWNIYTVFDFKSSIAQASSEMNISNFEAYKCLAEVYNATSNIYSTLKEDIDISNNEKVVRMLFFRLHSLMYFTKIHDIENMKEILKGLNNDMKKNK